MPNQSTHFHVFALCSRFLASSTKEGVGVAIIGGDSVLNSVSSGALQGLLCKSEIAFDKASSSSCIDDGGVG